MIHHVSEIPRTPMADDSATLVEGFRRARRDPELAVLEGFHAIKHALRFGAELLEVLSPDPDAAIGLAARLAPDVRGPIADLTQPVPEDRFASLAPSPPSTGLIALARRPRESSGATRSAAAAEKLDALLRLGTGAPLVLLEAPSDLANVGAVIRVAAGAGAAGVLTTGEKDPWHPVALRGSAGLHYALPVLRISELPDGPRPLVAASLEGDELRPGVVPDDAVLAFGTEREGLDEPLLRRAARRLRIPMEGGVSSLNLATSAAVLLYSWRCGDRPAAT